MITWQWYEPLKHTYNSIFYIPFYLEAVNTELELCQTLDPLCTFKIDVIGSKDCLCFEVTGYFVPEEALCALLRALSIIIGTKIAFYSIHSRVLFTLYL